MSGTKKVQVTLEDREYEVLARIARKEGKKLAAIVRESIRRYALPPESDRCRREALEDLLSLQPTSVPADYAEWERQYGALKLKSAEETR